MPHGQGDLASRLMELLGQLDPGLRRTDQEHAAGRELCLVAVVDVNAAA